MDILQNILAPIFGLIASLVFFVGTIIPGLLAQNISTTPAPVAQIATTTTEFPAAPIVATTSATAPPQENVQPAPQAAAPAKPVTVPAPPTAALLPPSSVPTKTEEQVNDETRAALVNILCLPQAAINGISGSGVFIDSRGVILTNAHVAQYFLLRNYPATGNIECVVRIGSPAQARYTATLLYVSPAWIAANASQLKAAQATGTGERDFAFLLITGRTDGSALPASFPRIQMDRGYVDTGYAMLLAAYPAGFLGADTVQKSLYASSAIAYVTQLFSFSDSQKVDLFSIGGTVVSQGGSSGGAAVRLSNGTLAGIITTATVGASTGDRDLRAVSLAHIDDSLAAEGKGGITALLTGDLTAKAAAFNAQVAPTLTAQLEAALKGN